MGETHAPDRASVFATNVQLSTIICIPYTHGMVVTSGGKDSTVMGKAYIYDRRSMSIKYVACKLWRRPKQRVNIVF